MDPVILRGEAPNGSGYGSGYGDGDGSGYGSGYGDGDGSGDGYGDGDGYGSGSGDGYGYGDGDGYGSGSGSGFGDGYGFGSGSGSGSGFGDGDGYGFGYGSGSGSGSGSKEYWASTVQYFAQKWAPEQRVRLRSHIEDGAVIAFWRSNDMGLPDNGGGPIAMAAPGVVHMAPGPLNLCMPGTLHATLLPPKWSGTRWWIVALIGEVIGDEEKYGALCREIIGECL